MRLKGPTEEKGWKKENSLLLSAIAAKRRPHFSLSPLECSAFEYFVHVCDYRYFRDLEDVRAQKVSPSPSSPFGPETEGELG